MTNALNYQNQPIPSYSGVTINITNPTVNAGNPYMTNPTNYAPEIYPGNISNNLQTQQLMQQPVQGTYPVGMQNPQTAAPLQGNYPASPQNAQIAAPAQGNYPAGMQNPQTAAPLQGTYPAVQQNAQPTIPAAGERTIQQQGFAQAYPPQYYMNNYNFPQYSVYPQQPDNAGAMPNNTPNGDKQIKEAASVTPQTSNGTVDSENAGASAQENTGVISQENAEEDMSSSKEIINELDARAAEQKELEKNGQKTRVIALTNEYIMSLENYLNNPNTEIRLMAAKEILTRLDEDKDRYNDAALNALLNKMLQDPEKLVRIAALSAFSSQLASGNDYTVQLLTKIQQNPNSDKEDVVEAADILLKMSADTEIKYTPANNAPPAEQKAEQ